MISKSVAFEEAEPVGQLDEPAAAAVEAELATFGFLLWPLPFPILWPPFCLGGMSTRREPLKQHKNTWLERWQLLYCYCTNTAYKCKYQ